MVFYTSKMAINILGTFIMIIQKVMEHTMIISIKSQLWVYGAKDK